MGVSRVSLGWDGPSISLSPLFSVPPPQKKQTRTFGNILGLLHLHVSVLKIMDNDSHFPRNGLGFRIQSPLRSPFPRPVVAKIRLGAGHDGNHRVSLLCLKRRGRGRALGELSGGVLGHARLNGVAERSKRAGGVDRNALPRRHGRLLVDVIHRHHLAVPGEIVLRVQLSVFAQYNFLPIQIGRLEGLSIVFAEDSLFSLRVRDGVN